MVKENAHLAVRWNIQTAGGKVQYFRNLCASHVEPLDDVINAGASLEILENR